jgi:hypothetical protein
MGNRRCTMRHLRVFQVMHDINVLVLVGAVPGNKHSWIRVRDSLHKPMPRIPPFPTYIDGVSKPDAVTVFCFTHFFISIAIHSIAVSMYIRIVARQSCIVSETV